MAETTLTLDELIRIHADAADRRGKSPFEDPATVSACKRVLLLRGETWAASVLCRPLDRRSIAFPRLPWLERGEAEILVLADAAELARDRA